MKKRLISVSRFSTRGVGTKWAPDSRVSCRHRLRCFVTAPSPLSFASSSSPSAPSNSVSLYLIHPTTVDKLKHILHLFIQFFVLIFFSFCCSVATLHLRKPKSSAILNLQFRRCDDHAFHFFYKKNKLCY